MYPFYFTTTSVSKSSPSVFPKSLTFVTNVYDPREVLCLFVLVVHFSEPIKRKGVSKVVLGQ